MEYLEKSFFERCEDHLAEEQEKTGMTLPLRLADKDEHMFTFDIKIVRGVLFSRDRCYETFVRRDGKLIEYEWGVSFGSLPRYFNDMKMRGYT